MEYQDWIGECPKCEIKKHVKKSAIFENEKFLGNKITM